MHASTAFAILILAAGMAQSVALALPAFKFGRALQRPQRRPIGPRPLRPPRPRLSSTFVNQAPTPEPPNNLNTAPHTPPSPPNIPNTPPNNLNTAPHTPPSPPNTPNTPPPLPPPPPNTPNIHPDTMNTYLNIPNTPPNTVSPPPMSPPPVTLLSSRPSTPGTTPSITPHSSPPSTPESSPPRTPQDVYPSPFIQERESLEHVNQRIKLVARAYVWELLKASMDDLD